MHDDHLHDIAAVLDGELTAQVVREHLELLHVERELALAEGLGGVAAYLRDLDQEIEAWRGAYVLAAVTEIAGLRAALSGPQQG